MDVPYKVISGDTLWNISVKYGTTVAAIKTKNNLTSDTLFIGQQLVIPVPETTKEFPYVVVSGDYLAKIAIQFKTTVDVIKTRNNLLTDSLSVGQKLIIPNANYIQ
jgi:peptidoglycan endopeptidase LytF